MVHWRGNAWVLIVLAWALAIGAMAAPAVEGNIAFAMGFIHADRTSTILLLMAGVMALVRVPWSIYPWLLMAGPIALLAAPLLARQVPPPGWLRRAAAIFLLTPWVMPKACVFLLTPAERQEWGWDHVYWGYYLFCIAHTLAFIAVQIAPWPPPRVDRRRGFPVVMDGGPESASQETR